LIAFAAPAFAAPELHGYGEIHFDYLDYGPDQTQPGGAPEESRLVFDLARLSLEIEAELGWDVEVEAEVEFEHGGTGAALELEYDEFGEYEQEVEAGGEVILEELYLEKKIGEHLELKLGRFYVAVGLLPSHHRPVDYVGAARPESEATMLPGVWDEIGVGAELHLDPVEITVQIVNGLDSTGFSSKRWVASGHQGRFEQVRATGLAGVLRVDVTPTDGVLIGASAYLGDTTANRPKPDLPDTAGALLIVDGHAAVDVGALRGRGAIIWGRLDDADLISEKNRRLSNNLNVARTAVASEALAVWAEVGVDVLRLFAGPGDHRIEPHLRVEYYDTMFAVGADGFDNPRFERTIIAAGLGHLFRDTLVSRITWQRRALGDGDLRAESAVRFTTGFTF